MCGRDDERSMRPLFPKLFSSGSGGRNAPLLRAAMFSSDSSTGPPAPAIPAGASSSSVDTMDLVDSVAMWNRSTGRVEMWAIISAVLSHVTGQRVFNARNRDSAAASVEAEDTSPMNFPSISTAATTVVGVSAQRAEV